jgi:hypothetical protein
MQRQMLQQLLPGRPTWVVWHSRDSNFLLFNVFNFQFPRALDTRLSLDLSCCIALCVLNATQTVLIEGWT